MLSVLLHNSSVFYLPISYISLVDNAKYIPIIFYFFVQFLYPIFQILNCLFAIHNTPLLVIFCSSVKYLACTSQRKKLPSSSYSLPSYSPATPICCQSTCFHNFLAKSPWIISVFSHLLLILLPPLHTSVLTHTPSHMHFLKSSPSYQNLLLNTCQLVLRTDVLLLFVYSYACSDLLYFLELLPNNLFHLLPLLLPFL
jgi:hypothetical protein